MIYELKFSVEPNDHTNNLLSKLKYKMNSLGIYNLVNKITVLTVENIVKATRQLA